MICKHIQMHYYKYVENTRQFLTKGAAAAVVERSMWHRIPLLRTTRSNWSNCARLLKYLTNISQIFCKCCTNTLQFHKKYITNMLQVKLLALWHRIPLLGRHLIQLHHATRPLQLHIIPVCNFFWIFICILIFSVFVFVRTTAPLLQFNQKYQNFPDFDRSRPDENAIL